MKDEKLSTGMNMYNLVEKYTERICNPDSTIKENDIDEMITAHVTKGVTRRLYNLYQEMESKYRCLMESNSNETNKKKKGKEIGTQSDHQARQLETYGHKQMSVQIEEMQL